MSELIEIAPGRWRFVRETIEPARSELPFPQVISDEMPPTEQVDGRFYTSKSAFRAAGRAHGLTEVGNEKCKPRERAPDPPENQRRRTDAIARAAAQWRQGRRPRED